MLSGFPRASESARRSAMLLLLASSLFASVDWCLPEKTSTFTLNVLASVGLLWRSWDSSDLGLGKEGSELGTPRGGLIAGKEHPEYPLSACLARKSRRRGSGRCDSTRLLKMQVFPINSGAGSTHLQRIVDTLNSLQAFHRYVPSISFSLSPRLASMLAMTSPATLSTSRLSRPCR